jgi:hypothetical protein
VAGPPRPAAEARSVRWHARALPASIKSPILLILVFGTLSATQLRGQAADSIVFRRGQVGADFSVGNGFFGAGLIRFGSPTSALVLDLNGLYSHTTGSQPNLGGPATQSQLSLRLGSRHYAVLGSHLRRLLTIGVEGTYTQQKLGTNSAASTTGWGGGAFADLGASWLITQHLAVGASWGATISYLHSRETQGQPPVAGTSNRVTVALNRVALNGQLYF